MKNGLYLNGFFRPYLYKAFYAPNFTFDFEFLSFFLNVILKTIFKNLIFNVFELERNNMFVSR